MLVNNNITKIFDFIMNANLINNAEQLIESINEEQKVKYIKRDRGLLERTENEEKIILTEDNRQVLLG